MSFHFPQKLIIMRISRILIFAFPDHKSLRVLDGARLSSHLQTSLLSSQGGHLLYGCMQPISDLNTAWCSESNSVQEARLYCFLLCSKTLKGTGISMFWGHFSVKQPQAHQEHMWGWKALGALWPTLSLIGFGFHLQTRIFQSQSLYAKCWICSKYT